MRKRNDDNLYHALWEIIDNVLCITAVKAGIGMPCADPWLADINCHTFDDDLDEEITKEVRRIYGLGEEHKYAFDGGTPLMMIALYIYLYANCSEEVQEDMKPFIIKLDEMENKFFGGE